MNKKLLSERIEDFINSYSPYGFLDRGFLRALKEWGQEIKSLESELEKTKKDFEDFKRKYYEPMS